MAPRSTLLLLAFVMLIPACTRRARPPAQDALATLRELDAGVDLDESGYVTFVNLSHTAVMDEQLACLAALTDLRQLWLYDTHITDEGVKHLSGLVSLESLVLGRTEVTDEGLNDLYNLKNLKELYLYETAVTTTATSRLQEVLTKTIVVR